MDYGLMVGLLQQKIDIYTEYIDTIEFTANDILELENIDKSIAILECE